MGLKAFKYRLKVNKTQEAKLNQTLELCRELYNAALAERKQAWKLNHKSISYLNQANQLPEIKKIRPDLAAVNAQVLQDVLRRLDKGFQAFFRRVQAGERAGHPRFKSKDRFNSLTYPQIKGAVNLAGDKLHLSKLGSFRVRLSRPLEGTLKTCTIKRDGKHWEVVFVCEVETKPLPKSDEVKAFDLGLTDFLIDQHGKTIANPRFFRLMEALLAEAQRQLSRKKKGSKAHRKAKERVQAIHRKIRNQRADFAHKLSTKLVRRYGYLFFESLRIRNMVRNGKLSKSIADVAWGLFLQLLRAKAESAERVAREVNASGTSQDCCWCGAKVPKDLSERTHHCPHCQLMLSRDHNSGIIILMRGVNQLVTNPIHTLREWVAVGQTVATGKQQPLTKALLEVASNLAHPYLEAALNRGTAA